MIALMWRNDGRRSTLGRREFLAGSAGTLMAASLPGSYSQLAAAAPGQARNPFDGMPVRTITAGVTFDDSSRLVPIERAGAFLQSAKALLESAGLTVQTTRIVTPPHGGFTDRLEGDAFVELIGSLQATAQPHSLGIGPSVVHANSVSSIVDRSVAAATRGISVALSIASQNRVEREALDAAAAVIRRIADTDAAANFNFAAVANIKSAPPFFPGGYHDGDVDQFKIGVEAAGLFMAAVARGTTPDERVAAIRERYFAALADLESLARNVASQTGWRYAGIDPTPAQWGENSIGAVIEALIGAPFGTPGTLAACRELTSIVKAAPVVKAGYCGLFLPPMEDATLAARAHDYFGMDALLAYSSVCGTGLDTVALPGDATLDEIRRILSDVATLAVRLDKPLTARLFPVPGKTAGESTGTVGDLFPMKVLRIR